MASFTLFTNLPVELQLAIWARSIPDPEPEVCIVWPLYIDEFREEPTLPFTVDTAWPAAAHVCRTSRAAVLDSGLLPLRHSPAAGFPVPYRPFNPSLDTLYWGRHQSRALFKFLKLPQNRPLARSLRHLATELPATYPITDLAELLRQHTIFVRSLTLILPDTIANQPSVHVSFLPPARRCRLRDIPDQTVGGITLNGVPFLEEHYNETIPLPAYLARRREEMERHVRRFGLQGPGDELGTTAWGGRDGGGSFSGVVVKAGTFVEYEYDSQGQERWVEVCRGRMLGQDGRAPEARRIAVAERKSPLEWRGLDEDAGWYGVEEFRPPWAGGYGMELGLQGWGR